jgi:glycosyltransferase involved in cell wall biosynthesis
VRKLRILILNLGIRNIVGGGERRALTTAESLVERGHDVSLATIRGVDWATVSRIFGKVPNFKERRLSPFSSLLPFTYQVPLSLMEFRKISRKFDLTINTQGDFVPAAADIVYLQGESMFTTKRRSDVYESWLRTFPGWRYALYRAYFTPYAWYLDRVMFDRLRDSSILLANSAYSAGIVRLQTGMKARVLYPPVDTIAFSYPHDAPKEKLVLSVGRFSAEKGYEVIPRIAKLCQDYEFIIAGTVTSQAVVDKLEREALSQGLTNVRLFLNVPVDQLKSLYARAQFYLHTHLTEPFGQTVVEAMSASCIPLVPKSGGPWLDITQQGKYGIGYSDEMEAAGAIRGLGEEKSKEMRFLAKGRSAVFSETRYKKEIAGIVEGLHGRYVSGHRRRSSVNT